MALIMSAVETYLIVHAAAEETTFDKLPLSISEYNGPCHRAKVSSTWKILITRMVSLVLLDVIPFVAVCFLNTAIIKIMKQQAEAWGREDPQKLVNYE